MSGRKLKELGWSEESESAQYEAEACCMGYSFNIITKSCRVTRLRCTHPRTPVEQPKNTTNHNDHLRA